MSNFGNLTSNLSNSLDKMDQENLDFLDYYFSLNRQQPHFMLQVTKEILSKLIGPQDPL